MEFCRCLFIESVCTGNDVVIDKKYPIMMLTIIIMKNIIIYCK